MAEDKNLKTELIKIAVDKLLFGAIILMLGFFTTNLIEKYKTSLSFTSELNKTRVAKVAEVWEKVFAYQEELERIEPYVPMRPPVRNAKFEDGVKGLEKQSEINNEIEQAQIKEAQNRRKEVVEIANKNRFWIGEEDYGKIMEYTRTMQELETFQFTPERDKILKKLQEGRQTLVDLRNKILKE